MHVNTLKNQLIRQGNILSIFSLNITNINNKKKIMGILLRYGTPQHQTGFSQKLNNFQFFEIYALKKKNDN